MEQPFEKYSLLLLVYVHSRITNKRKRNIFKWLLHQSAAATLWLSSEQSPLNLEAILGPITFGVVYTESSNKITPHSLLRDPYFVPKILGKNSVPTLPKGHQSRRTYYRSYVVFGAELRWSWPLKLSCQGSMSRAVEGKNRANDQFAIRRQREISFQFSNFVGYNSASKITKILDYLFKSLFLFYTLCTSSVSWL